MLDYCVKKWNENKDNLREALIRKIGNERYFYMDYKELISLVVEYIFGSDWSKEDITIIDDGDYQGTMLFAFHRNCYQPSEWEYLFGFVSYGSCSYCDALLAACDNDTLEGKVSDLLALSLNMVQSLVRPFKNYWNDSEEME